jgi:hypothetical protein
LKRKDNCLVRVSPLLEMARNWRRLLTSALTEEEIEIFRRHERTRRVLGDEGFQKRLEKRSLAAFCGGENPVRNELQPDTYVCCARNSRLCDFG